MPVHELNLQSLIELDDGRVNESYNLELGRLVADCEDRPGDRNPRKINLELSVIPIIDEDGHLSDVEGRFRITTTLPKRRSKVYTFGVRRGGKLCFHDMDDDRPLLPQEDQAD